MDKVIPLERIRQWKPCKAQMLTVVSMYPDGVPLTREAAKALKTEGVDILWGACHLLSREQRSEFIVFTLRQRQPALVRLFRGAGLEVHAAAIAALDWTDLEQAYQVLATARVADWDASSVAASDASSAAARDTHWATSSDADSRDTSRDTARAANWVTSSEAVSDAARDAQIEWLLAAISPRPAA